MAVTMIFYCAISRQFLLVRSNKCPLEVSIYKYLQQLVAQNPDIYTHTPYIGITLWYLCMSLWLELDSWPLQLRLLSWLERCTGIAGPQVPFLPESRQLHFSQLLLVRSNKCIKNSTRNSHLQIPSICHYKPCRAADGSQPDENGVNSSNYILCRYLMFGGQ